MHIIFTLLIARGTLLSTHIMYTSQRTLQSVKIEGVSISDFHTYNVLFTKCTLQLVNIERDSTSNFLITVHFWRDSYSISISAHTM